MDRVKKSVYVETTIPSYATGWVSRDLIVAGEQATTNLFWEQERGKYALFVSEVVVRECRNGDPDAAKRRLDFINGIESLPRTAEADGLAEAYQTLLQIPDHAKADCLHLAICVVGHIDYLLTWNCTHLGPPAYGKVRAYNDTRNLWTPELVTPAALMNYDYKEK
jgi:hypothetical protein